MTAWNLLETYVSFFFWARIIHLQLSSKEKLRSAKFQTSLDAVDFCAFNFYLIISHPHMESLKGNQFGVPSFIHLLASYSRADWQQVFTCQRFAIFFAASKKARWILAKVFTPCRRLTTFWGLRCDKSI